MAWGYRKSIKIAPGIRLTASKRGLSASGGPRGAKVSMNTRREKRASLGFLGMFWRKKL